MSQRSGKPGWFAVESDSLYGCRRHWLVLDADPHAERYQVSARHAKRLRALFEAAADAGLIEAAGGTKRKAVRR